MISLGKIYLMSDFIFCIIYGEIISWKNCLCCK
uniref:Uncharacterized protein n=1 Tax=virus sp. ctkyY8 TaxID=2827995 RepID=A0A8S5REC4_9VIRU|nr:MAG TPA: hypothetical protein [virus sp. ctkyY8]